MTIEDDIAFLERIPIFRRLGSGALRIVAIGAESYSVQAGQALFTVGEAADGGYVVQRGSFSLSTERGNEAEIVAGPGTLLGETALIAETKRPATARAREDFDRAAHLALDVPAHARRFSGRRTAAARPVRVADGSMGARDRECPRRAVRRQRA